MPKNSTKESSIERYLYNECKKRGWLCEKFTSPGKRSVPDRIITTPNRMYFVELKAPGKKPTKLQAQDHKKRKILGFPVWVIDTKEKVNSLVKGIELEGLV